MLASGPTDLHILEEDLIGNRSNIRKSLPSKRLLILGLTQEGQLVLYQTARLLVPVIAVCMGYEHGVNIVCDFLHRKRQRHERVIARIWRILDGWTRTRIVEHRVHKKSVAAVFDDQCGVPDQAQAHIHFLSNTSFAANTVLQ